MMMMNKAPERRERIASEHQGQKERQRKRDIELWGRGDNMTGV